MKLIQCRLPTVRFFESRHHLCQTLTKAHREMFLFFFKRPVEAWHQNTQNGNILKHTFLRMTIWIMAHLEGTDVENDLEARVPIQLESRILIRSVLSRLELSNAPGGFGAVNRLWELQNSNLSNKWATQKRCALIWNVEACFRSFNSWFFSVKSDVKILWKDPNLIKIN